ncbi:MAG TPA: ABC transporter ATP-binding protein [Mycobacteriales bacterium]|nr:ABC transporter ATP-binding protein [Mycobacteriales bacterium]
MTAVLTVDLHVRRGAFHLQARLQAAAGETLALVGPNGSGKSTLLRALAGLQPATGTLTVDGADTNSLPAHERAVGWVPQEGALFPHLNARDNVAFGIGGRRGQRVARELLAELGLLELAERRPAQLSGGQAQKVALARALARRPRLLLLDEPLAALDVAARAEVRRALRARLSSYDGVTLLVTHDPVDILTLATRVVALENGSVVQDAPAGEVARAPRSPWLAELMGSNAFAGRLRGHAVLIEGGGSVTAAEVTGAPPDGVAALAVVPAHAVTVHREEPDSSARNTWPVVVRDLVATGGRVRLRCDGAPPVLAEVTPEAVADLRLADGAQVWASVKATEVTVVLL